ncbi:MAG TPA: phosphoenolpyruvate--protein phosphotransferase [Candidatus Galloscillospira excrementavium]|nr:phosphoenolpyruvate--protein phosphotransferase [Candidatus Galloscillospira excrementavium]
MLHGIGASEGIGIGTAVLVAEPDLDYSHVTPAGPEAEKARLAAAVDTFIQKTSALADTMREQVGEKQAEILSGQVMMLSDPYMQSQMNDAIDAGGCAEGAVDSVCQMYVDMFSSMDDEMMRQRASDVGDLRARLLGLLLGREAVDLSAVPAGSVLVARDFTPSMTAALRRENVAAIVTEAGGFTSHSAILARTMSLPAVLSVPGVTALVKNGDTLVVDGGEGVVLQNPEPSQLKAYRARQAELAAQRAALEQFRGLPTRTADGREVQLFCNIGSDRDLAAVLENTGEGVGLFRTEFLFLDRAALPTEEEQFQVYRTVAEGLAGREVIIRTLDVGGDKDIPYLGLKQEENPFLGCRAIRYCLGHQEMFRAQLRALLRASAFGKVRIMLPLVTRLDEVRAARALLEELKGELDRSGIAYDKNIPLGVMVETPAAALIADLLAREADFFSIGTNDLTQYTMAVDRGNADVAYLYSPLDPAVLRSLRAVIRAGKAAGIPVGMCGEAAADPRLIPLLLSFGLDEFSVSPAAVLSTRRAIAGWTAAGADAVAERAMGLATEAEVAALLKGISPR